MFNKINRISKTSVEGMVYQIRYLINEKKVSDTELAWYIHNILSDKGIPVEYIPMPLRHIEGKL